MLKKFDMLYESILSEMKIDFGDKGLNKSYQKNFTETIKCIHCGGEARIGFVAHEGINDDDKNVPYLCQLHKNGGKGDYWLHDCCAVAVYFCKECLDVTAKYNQG